MLNPPRKKKVGAKGSRLAALEWLPRPKVASFVA
jgi:hypothetical protein